MGSRYSPDTFLKDNLPLASAADNPLVFSVFKARMQYRPDELR